MQHLYHERTNTISSRSTSSSSSKHSQSKSNDTAITSTNLLQLSLPLHQPSNLSQTNTVPRTLCFRNSHVNNNPVDYHIYETIPSESPTYTFCNAHSAFKPVVQSNPHTIRPYATRTNKLNHQLSSSEQSYDKLLSVLPNMTTVMPICCHHYSLQHSTGTIHKHSSSSSAPFATLEQINTRSESIV